MLTIFSTLQRARARRRPGPIERPRFSIFQEMTLDIHLFRRFFSSGLLAPPIDSARSSDRYTRNLIIVRRTFLKLDLDTLLKPIEIAVTTFLA